MLSQVLRQGRNIFATQGVLAVLAGVAILVWPEHSLTVVAYVFAGWLLLDGVVAIIMWARTRALPGAQFSLVRGIVELLLGVLVALTPQIFAAFIVGILSFLTLIVGMILVSLGLGLRRAWLPQWWVFVLVGALMAVGGVLIMVFPRESIFALLTFVSVVLLVVGAAFLALAFKLGSKAHTLAEFERQGGAGPGWAGKPGGVRGGANEPEVVEGEVVDDPEDPGNPDKPRP